MTMNTTRILHVDDEPDIREVVTIALGLDPEIAVQSCASGGDAVAAAASWLPNLILLDVMMPGMDGPATLHRLRENSETAGIPVVFMTARAQPNELERFISLGAEGVICKPFDPMMLVSSVRTHLQVSPTKLTERRQNFSRRARVDAGLLEEARGALNGEGGRIPALETIRGLAHGLAVGAGVVGLSEFSAEAVAVERTTQAVLDDKGSIRAVEGALDVLVAAIRAL